MLPASITALFLKQLKTLAKSPWSKPEFRVVFLHSEVPKPKSKCCRLLTIPLSSFYSFPSAFRRFLFSPSAVSQRFCLPPTQHYTNRAPKSSSSLLRPPASNSACLISANLKQLKLATNPSRSLYSARWNQPASSPLPRRSALPSVTSPSHRRLARLLCVLQPPRICTGSADDPLHSPGLTWPLVKPAHPPPRGDSLSCGIPAAVLMISPCGPSYDGGECIWHFSAYWELLTPATPLQNVAKVCIRMRGCACWTFSLDSYEACKSRLFGALSAQRHFFLLI